jgi:hypothetical protein
VKKAAAGGESLSEFSGASFFCRDRRVPTKLREAGWNLSLVKSSGTDSGEEE